MLFFLVTMWKLDSNSKEIKRENNKQITIDSLRIRVHYLEEFQRNLIMNHPELDPIGARVKTN